MSQFRWIAPEDSSFVTANQLGDLAALLARADGHTVAAGHRQRETLRFDLPRQDGQPRAVFVKRERGTPPKYVLGHLLAGNGPWSKARSEFEILRRVRAAGLHCPRPVVCLQSPFPRMRAALVLDALIDTCELNHFLARQPFADDALQRAEFFAQLGREIARLHSTGVNHPDLYSIHIHVGWRDRRWEVHFLDFQRSMHRAKVAFETRVRDLAALAATLPERLADQTDRSALWDAYLAESGVNVPLSKLVGAIEQRAERLLTRRKFWEIRESDTAGHQTAPRVELEGPTTLWIDGAYSEPLERAGLTSFSAMMSTRDGLLLRSLRDRENWRLRLDRGGEASAPASGAYLKKHHTRTVGSWLRAKAGWGPGQTAGRVEARNVASLARGGIAAMRLIAYGEKLHDDGLLESFVLTEELVGYTQLDHFLRQRFAPRSTTRATRRDPCLEELLRSVARVASQFHRLGYNHRDLYCCHFFIRETSHGNFQVNLIDLQRVEHRHRLRRRWLVKDLAQLAYSVPRDRVTCTQKLAFMKHYLGVRKLDRSHKRFIRQVLAKQHAMERNLGAHP